MFKIPIIRVKSVGEESNSHIVGTDSHDSLYIDKYSGGIHYHNIQCCASTQKIFDDGNDPDYGFEFQGVEGYFHEVEVEFVTPEKLLEIIIETIQVQADQKVKLLELLQYYHNTSTEEAEKIEEAEEKYNSKILW